MKIGFKLAILSTFIYILSGSLYSQVSIKDSAIFTTYFKASYALQIPGGDVANKFGPNLNVGGGVGFKLKSNFLFEFHYNYLFGDQVKDNGMVDELVTSDGFLYNNSGEPAIWSMQQRGYALKLDAGKIIPILSPNPNSGILVKMGFGYLQHKVKFRNDLGDVPQFKKPRVYGYDRLTSGLLLTQFLGYQYFGNNRLINFYAGVEMWEGFTKGRRDYQVDMDGPYNQNFTDLFLGVKLGWVIPFYKRMPKEFYID